MSETREEDPSPREQTFTEYVRALVPPAAPPDGQLFSLLWDALRVVLQSEIKKRGLWQSSPQYLGIFGWSSWSARGARRGRGPRESSALDELVAECYPYIFIHRLRSLQAQLKVKPNVEGLVILNLRHFLLDRQKEHDPVGFRVFQVVQTAVQKSLSRGDLFVLAGDPRIRNETLLGWHPPAPGRAPRGIESAAWEQWADRLMPALMVAKGKALQAVVDELCGGLRELESEGVEAFLFREILQPIRNRVRARWDASLRESVREEARVASASPGLIADQGYRHLAQAMETRLRRLTHDSRRRGELLALWRYLCLQAEDPAAETGSAWEDGRAFSRRKISTELQIPRDRLPELFAELQRIFEEHRTSERQRQV